jgi:predicted Zn-dependent protease with MMP-like domain
MNKKKVIMNFTTPPNIEDIEVIGEHVLENLPEELMEFCESLAINVEEIPDETVEMELDLDDPYELVALYRKGSQIAPGVESKTANDDDVILIFRRPLLDMWCELNDDLSDVLRQVMIEEIGASFDFSEDEIEEMTLRHHQGML